MGGNRGGRSLLWTGAALLYVSRSLLDRARPGGEALRERALRGLDPQSALKPRGPEADGERAAEITARELHRKSRAWGVLPWPLVRPWRSESGGSWERAQATGTTFVLGSGAPEERWTRWRDVGVSSLPLFTAERMGAAADRVPSASGQRASLDEIRLAVYREIIGAWRLLTDVRFRLMNMLPALSIVAFVPLVLVIDGSTTASATALVLACLGLCLAHGLHIYEQRNNGLYDELISRARRIEAELGIETGLMLGRPSKPNARVNHGRATTWVFTSVKVAWLTVAIALAASLVSGLLDG